jgi:hypothetical protein
MEGLFSRLKLVKLLKRLVGASGFEPPTSWSRIRRLGVRSCPPCIVSFDYWKCDVPLVPNCTPISVRVAGHGSGQTRQPSAERALPKSISEVSVTAVIYCLHQAISAASDFACRNGFRHRLLNRNIELRQLPAIFPGNLAKKRQEASCLSWVNCTRAKHFPATRERIALSLLLGAGAGAPPRPPPPRPSVQVQSLPNMSSF